MGGAKSGRRDGLRGRTKAARTSQELLKVRREPARQGAEPKLTVERGVEA